MPPRDPDVRCLCAGYHKLYAFYSANQYYNYDLAELDQNIQSADTTTSLTVNNSTTVAGQAITFTGANGCPARASVHDTDALCRLHAVGWVSWTSRCCRAASAVCLRGRC